jgi:hypothetical protein
MANGRRTVELRPRHTLGSSGLEPFPDGQRLLEACH